MTEKIKVAELPQAERDELIKQAQDVGINNAMMANWYVDTLKSKIAEAIAKKGETSEQTGEQTDGQGVDAQPGGTNKPAEQEQSTDTQTDGDEPDLTQEQKDLDKDEEQPPVKASAPKAATTKEVKVVNKEKSAKATICHICRAKVIDGKCTSCGFEISKR